jgi:two-component system, NtrC family, response regulator HydG
LDTLTGNGPPVVLVDDDPQFLLSSGITLRAAGIRPVMTIEDSGQVLPLLAETDAAAVVLDLTMPPPSGRELLEKIREEHPHIPVIILTGVNEVDTAVGCMKGGAADYLVKPIEPSRFLGSIRTAVEMRALREEVSSLKRHLLSGRLENEAAFAGMITESRKLRAIFQYVEAIAPSRQPVLISGETGVGKELMARAVHALSGCRGEFVAVNVAGLDDTMLSDALFGHRRGAYTGADHAREGLIARAGGGTLFLDEIGDMSNSSQVKLLRLLEEKKYYPLGSDVPKTADARIVCATHRNLQERIAKEAFRKDLYYRLSAHQVHIPPLREHKEDIPILVDHFLEEAARSVQKKPPTPPAELYTLLSAYHYPGNVRELKTMVYDAVIRHRSGVLSIESFRQQIGHEASLAAAPSSDGGGGGAPFPIPGRFPTLREAESHLIGEALRRAGNNQGIAATLLGITRQALNKRLVRGAPGQRRGS